MPRRACIRADKGDGDGPAAAPEPDQVNINAAAHERLITGEVAAYYASQRAFAEERLATQATRMWEIIQLEAGHVHADRSIASSYLGHKPCNTTVYGQEVGDWLALSREPGYIRMRKMGQQLVRLMKDLIITLHVGQLESNGFAEALCTTMSGEELAEVQVSPTDPVGDVRAKIEELILYGDFNLILPDGRVLSDDSAPMADVLGDAWAQAIDEGDLLVEEFLI